MHYVWKVKGMFSVSETYYKDQVNYLQELMSCGISVAVVLRVIGKQVGW